MTALRQAEDNNNNEQTVHDFTEEHKLILTLGGFILLKKPFFGRILNILLVACVSLLYIYLSVMAIITLALKPDEKVLFVKIIQFISVMIFGVVSPALSHSVRNQLNTAVETLKKGVYLYGDQNESHSKIKKYRVSQIRRITSIITKAFMCCALSNTLFIPLKSIITGRKYHANDLLNPYLPLPIYMPFDTRKVTNYIIAFLTNAIFNFFVLFAAVFSTIMTYSSCTLQLVAQLEILIDSLQNIETRAHSKLEKKYFAFSTSAPMTVTHEKAEFQRTMCICLRENIIHHHAILRYSEAISPFIEVMDFVAVALFSIIFAASVMAMLEYTALNFEVLGTLLIDVCGFFLMCWLGQFVQEKSAQVTTYLYSTPWPDCGKNFNALMRIMMMNTQKPIALKIPVFNMDMSLQSFGDCVSAGYKIINLLR